LRQEWKSSEINVTLREAQLKKQVSQVFYQILYIAQKKKLLLYADSIYSEFYNKSLLRLEKGESNVLEKTFAESQLGQISIQLGQLKQDSAIWQLQFQWLLNTSRLLIPLSNEFLIDLPVMITIDSIPEHPVINQMRQQIQVADASLQLEKSRLWPDLTITYNNGSIKGIGADNKYYSGSYRFNAIQAGIGIPIFSKASREKIKSFRVYRLLAEGNLESGLQTFQSEYRVAAAQYNKYLQAVHYYERTGLKNANLIHTTANQQLANGIINYLEWVQLINQVTLIKNEYIEAVKNLNESVIQLKYFNNK
jgi:cobalt-zinc-cadmium resistance protein CzcA